MIAAPRYFARLTAVSVAALVWAAPAFAAEDSVLANINGQAITEADVQMALRDLAPQFEKIPAEKQKSAALQALIEIRLMAAQGRTDGIDQTEEFKRQQQFLMDRVLHQSVIDSAVAQKITEEDLKKRYDMEVAARPAEEEVKARHILVKTDEEAKKLIVELDGGAKFEELAAKHTTDPSGKDSGGDLGYFGKGMMVPEFEQAAFTLEVGTYTKAPVQSQFGFHIIKLEEKRAKPAPAFEQVKDQISSIVLRERYTTYLDTLRSASKVEILDPALKADLEPKK
ncbi:MAG: peptidylprolyl isomerase [Notoacmeibacter sp.]